MSETDFTDLSSDLITPEEAAILMSKRAGYRITQDDIKQLRHHGKIKAAKQLKRTTLYERLEIEQAPLPKKHYPENLAPEDNNSSIHIETTTQVNYKDPEISTSGTTWRTLLSGAISDPAERQRVAEVLKVSTITLARWAAGATQPRQETLRLLPDALPQYRKQLGSLIEEEFPELATTSFSHVEVQKIPSTFYSFVHEININSPLILRRYSIIRSILQHMLDQLDPFQVGMFIFIAQCVPPISGKQVHSLRKAEGQGTGPWRNDEHFTQFFGNESYVGYAALTSHPVILPGEEHISLFFPDFYSRRGKSIAAYPILLSGRIAGSLCIISTQPDYFSQTRLELIQDYVDLLVIAFDQSDFYRMEDINLHVMPPHHIQQPLLTTVQQQVNQRMIDSTRDGLPLTRLQIELRVWQELEKILLDRT